jgi:hypothetical protein
VSLDDQRRVGAEILNAAGGLHPTNGNGATNGLHPTNDNGATNGLHPTNGNGATNGVVAEEPYELPVLTARALCALDPGPAPQIVGPLLLAGERLVIGAETGAGKTTFAMRLIAPAVTGGEFLGWAADGGGTVMVIDAEQGLRHAQRVLREAGLDQHDDVHYARVPDGLALDSDPKHVTAVEQALDRLKPTVVVADPTYKLHRGDSNEERAAVDLMRQFDGWREVYGFALVTPMHTRGRRDGERAMSLDRIFGSTAWLRGAETIVGLERVGDGYARLHILKVRGDTDELTVGDRLGLLYDRTSGFRRDANDGERQDRCVDKVRGHLEESPGLTIEQLCGLTDNASRTVREALRDLTAVGEGPEGATRRYSLPNWVQDPLELRS